MAVYNKGEVFAGIKLTESECLNESKVCLEPKGIAMAKEITKEKNPELAVEKMKVITGCIGEKCVAQKLGVSGAFKPDGPRYGTALISDSNIDNVLATWTKEFPKFYHYTYCMDDFYNTGSSLTDVPFDVVLSKGYKSAACILNTDISTGRGLHWRCLYMTPSSIEYFNSSGNPPTNSVLRYMLEQKAKIPSLELVYGTGIVHQALKTECGIYCLYFIRKRLEGTSYDFFKYKRIDDLDVQEFRKRIFSSNK